MKLRQYVNIQKSIFFQNKRTLFCQSCGKVISLTLQKMCLCVFFQNKVATFYLNSGIDIDPDYEGRALLDVNMDQRVSTLQLKGLKAEDSGRFQCSVLIPGDDEGNTEASTSLLVLGENELLFNMF